MLEKSFMLSMRFLTVSSGHVWAHETAISWYLLPVFKLIPLHDGPNFLIRRKIIPNRLGSVIR